MFTTHRCIFIFHFNSGGKICAVPKELKKKKFKNTCGPDNMACGERLLRQHVPNEIEHNSYDSQSPGVSLS